MCGSFLDALLKLPVLLYKFVAWIIDSSGNINSDILRQVFPTGAILDSYATLSAPDWLLCDGAEYPKTTYPDLYTAIGDLFGTA